MCKISQLKLDLYFPEDKIIELVDNVITTSSLRDRDRRSTLLTQSSWLIAALIAISLFLQRSHHGFRSEVRPARGCSRRKK